MQPARQKSQIFQANWHAENITVALAYKRDLCRVENKINQYARCLDHRSLFLYDGIGELRVSSGFADRAVNIRTRAVNKRKCTALL